jgi:uncharacterized protein YbaP (TraB family)
MSVQACTIAVIDDDSRVLESLVSLWLHLDTKLKATIPQNNFWKPAPFETVERASSSGGATDYEYRLLCDRRKEVRSEAAQKSESGAASKRYCYSSSDRCQIVG